MSRSPLLRERLSAHRIAQLLVPFCALVAVVIGLLALHSLGSAHVHAADTEMSSPAVHNHDHAAPSAVDQSSSTVLMAGPHGLGGAADCPAGGGMDCCVTMAACVMVLALLSVSIALGVVPVSVVGIIGILVLAAIIAFRPAPVRPPSLAQLSILRI